MAGSGYILFYCIYILYVHSCHFIDEDISIKNKSNQSVNQNFITSQRVTTDYCVAKDLNLLVPKKNLSS